MPRIARQSIEDLLRVADIVDVASAYVKLRPASGSLKGLCPFHHEKTPSFVISPTKQLYHCFGCGAGGGVIDFVMKIENLDYVDALKFLADRYNVVLQEEETHYSSEQTRVHELKKRLYEMNRVTAKYFYNVFMAPESAVAQEYAAKRGLDGHTVNKYGVGYAKPEWTALYDMLREQGFTDAEIDESGLIIKKENGRRYDRFRNRLMFPIIDVRGNVLGFGGRALDDSVKYLNSPETPVFHKGYNVFSLNLAKNEGLKNGLILVEGYMDVISLYQRGITNAVAGLGTALTPDQARLLKRYANEIFVCYDNDEAGHKAALRAIEILEKEGNKLRIVEVAGVKDPDEYIQKKGVESFRNLLKSAKSSVGFKLSLLRGQYDITDITAKVEYVQAAADLLGGLESDVERDAYIRKIAYDADIAEDALRAETNKRLRKKTETLKKRQEFREERQMVEQARETASNPAYRAERMLLNLIFFEKKAYNMVTDGKGEALFTDEVNKRIYQEMVSFLSGGNRDAQMFLSDLPELVRPAAADILYESFVFADNDEVSKAVEDCLERMEEEQRKASAKHLNNELSSFEKIRDLLEKRKKGGD